MRAVRLAMFSLIWVLVIVLNGDEFYSIPQYKRPHVSSLVVQDPTNSIPNALASLEGNNGNNGDNQKVGLARLVIPAIGINAPIQAVGITSSGDLAVPTKNPWESVGWYRSGPRPGEQGSAVIDGHLDQPGGYPAVFWRLRDIHLGNQIIIVETDGKSLHFHVIGIAFYAPQNAPIQEIFGNDSGNYLNLITCAGDWIAAEHQTTLRLVVYASLNK